MNKQNYSLFYDTGCCDMVSRYAAIKSIGSRAKQEPSIRISIGGFGNAEVKSNHGIFQVKLSVFNGSEATFSGVLIKKQVPSISVGRDSRRKYCSWIQKTRE